MASPKTVASALASQVFGVQKIATGEMSQSELDANGREEWPLHYAIADALGGEVRPFDIYQGPYVEIPGEGRMFISSEDGIMGQVFNEDTRETSQPFDMQSPAAENAVVEAALEVCEHPEEVLQAAEGHLPSEPGGVEYQKDPNELRLTPEDKGFLGDLGIRAGLNSPLDGKGVKIACMLKNEVNSSNPELQKIVGDPLDQPYSAFVQFGPNMGNMQTPNPLSPIEGDQAFFAYFIPGAVFQSHDGQQWVIDAYTPGPYGVEIYNRWYPRQRAFVNLDDVRRSIHSYVEPVQVVIPPPPPGVSYYGQPVRIIDGKSHL